MASLTAHLLHRYQDDVHNATHHGFLQAMATDHTPSEALKTWFVQQRFYQQGYVRFIGGILSKLVLPSGADRMEAREWRTLGLLSFCLDNMKREAEFLEGTSREDGWIDGEAGPEPSMEMKSYQDVFASAVDHSSPLLVGLTALWATEECYLRAWQYVCECEKGKERMQGSVQDRLISNWTNSAFQEFVVQIRSLVDEMGSNHQKDSHEWGKCEEIVGQILQAECKSWPPVGS